MEHKSAVVASLLAVLAVSICLAPASAAAIVYTTTVDNRLGTLNDRLESAVSTYGESEAFQGARDHVSRAALLLTANATVSAVSEMSTAAAALETGRAQSIAAGQQDRDQAIRNAAVDLAGQAQSVLASVQGGLDDASRAGMSVQEMDHALLTAYTALLAEDRLRMHETALRGWDAGERGDAIERSLVGNAGSAVLLADVASSLWVNGSMAASDEGVVLDRAALSELAHSRAEHARESAPGLAETSRERVDTLARDGHVVLALAAFSLWAQDVTFTEQQMSREDVADEQLLEEEAPKVQAWVDALGVDGSLPVAALESARVASGGNASLSDRAFAASLVVLSVEHVALLVDGYTGVERALGTTLPPVPDEGWPAWAIWGGLLGFLGLLVGTAIIAHKRDS